MYWYRRYCQVAYRWELSHAHKYCIPLYPLALVGPPMQATDLAIDLEE